MLTCIIIDDEQPCINALQVMIEKKLAHILKISGTIDNPLAAAAMIELNKPDIVFLDVEMPVLDGINLLSSLPGIDFQVIFTTAHQHYALQAIKLNAIDYLLKPIDINELTAAVEKCVKRKNEQSNYMLNQLLDQFKNNNAPTKKISLPDGNTYQLVSIKEIVRIEAESNYSIVYFQDKTKKVVTKTLKDFEDQLSVHNFLRVHHSHLVNLDYVIGYKNQENGYIIMQGNIIIEISRRKKQEVLQRIQSL